MPQAVIAIGVAVAGAVGGAAVAAFVQMSALTAFAIGAATIAAAGMLANKVISNLYEMPTMDTDASRQSTVKSTIEPQKIIYGETLVSGPISFVGTYGSKNRVLAHAVVLAGHEVNAITDIHFDDEVITNAQINGSGFVTSGKFGPTGGQQFTEGGIAFGYNICKINKHLGATGQTADADLVGAFAAYTSNHKGTGLAYISTHWLMKDDSQATWDQYTPQNIKALVQGRKVYDYRLDTETIKPNVNNASFIAYSTNPVWCLIDYLINTDFGMSVNPNRIDWDAAEAAADACDVLVDVPGGTEKRFTCNGVLFGTDSHKTNINKLLSSMNGMLSYTNGQFVIRAGAYEAPSVSLDEDSLAGAVSVKTSVERSDRFNTVTGVFIDPSQNYKSTEFPEVFTTAARNRDNGEILTKEIQLPMTNSRYMAQRIANKLVQQSDQQKVVTFPTNLSGMEVAVGDRVSVSLDEFNWSNKVFLCLGWTLSDSGNGGVNLILREDDSGSYADPAVGEYSTISATGALVEGFRGVPDPSNLSATAGLKSIELNWTNPDNMSDVLFVEVFASPNSSWANRVKIGEVNGTQFFHDGSTTADPIDIGDERYYWVRARAYSTGEDATAVSDRNPDNDTSTINATVGGVDFDDVVGDAKPEDNATVGATVGSDLYNTDGSTVLNAVDVLNQVLEEQILNVQIETGEVLDLETGQDVIIQNLGDVAIYVNESNQILNSSIGSLSNSFSNLENTIVDLTSGVSDVYVQATPPVAGVGGIPDPIPTFSRWYDSDDSNEPYYWDSTQWVSLADPRIANNASAITTLQSGLNTANSNISANTSAISVLDATTISQGNSIASLSSDVTTLQSELNTAEGDIVTNASAISGLTTRVTTAENEITSQASDITNLQSSVGTKARTFFQDDAPTATAVGDLWFDTNDGNKVYRWSGSAWVEARDGVISSNATAISGLTTRVTQTETDITSQASDITSLESDVTSINSTVNGNSAAITNLNARVTTAEGTITSQSSDITELESSVTSLNSSVSGNANAISGLDTRVTSAEGSITSQASDITALESDVTSLDTTVSGNSTAISSLDTRVTSAEGAITVNSSDITSLESSLGATDANVSANATAISSLDTRVTSAEGSITSQASDITQLQSDLTTLDDDVSGNSTALTALTTRVTTAEGEITTNATDITALETTVNDGTTGVAATASGLSALDTRVTTAEGTISTNSTDITALETTVNDATTGVVANSTAISNLDSRVTTAEGTISATASDTTALQVSFTDLTKIQGESDDVIQTEGGADLDLNLPTDVAQTTSLATTSLDARLTVTEGTITTQSSDVTQLRSDLTSLDSNVSGNATAIDSLTTRVTDNEGDITATASSLTALSSTVTDPTTGLAATAAVAQGANTLAQTLDGEVTSLQAEAYLTVSAGGNIAGFKATADSTSSNFTIQADRFALVSTNEGHTTVPFVVDGATGLVGLTANVVIDGDLITTGSISADRLTIDNVTLDTDASGNLIIKDGGVGQNQIATGAVTSLKITNEAVTNAKIAVDAIQGAVIAAGAITADKILNGAISELKLADDAVTTAKLAVDSVTADIVAANAITSESILNGAISELKLADDAVTTAKLATSAVTADIIATNSISTTKIQDNAIETAKISAGAITTAKISAGAVTADTIAANAVTTAKINAGAVTADTIAASAITTAKIAAGAVTAVEIAANTITSGKIAAGAITAETIASNAVTAVKINANAVTSDKITAGAITTAKIAAGAVTAAEIAANTITAAKIAAGTITATEIAADAITADKINVTDLSAISATLGTVTAGTFKTAESGYRVEISDTGDFPIWYGTGAKTAENGLFYVDAEGEVYINAIIVARAGSTVAVFKASVAPIIKIGFTSSITTNAAVVTISNGTGPYTYSWTRQITTQGPTPTISSSTSASPTFTATGMQVGIDSTSIWEVAVTDTATSETATAQAYVTIVRDA